MEEWKDRNEGFGGGWGTTTVGGTAKEQRIICHWERTEDKMERTGDIGRLRYMTGGKIIFTEKNIGTLADIVQFHTFWSRKSIQFLGGILDVTDVV